MPNHRDRALVIVAGALLAAPITGCKSSNSAAATSDDARVKVLEAKVTSLQADLAAALSTIATLEVGLTAARSDLTTVQGRLATAQSSITTAESSMSTLQTSVQAAQASISALQTNVTAAQASISTLQTNVAGAGSSITSLQESVATINASSVMALAPYLSVTTSWPRKARLDGFNLQITNGSGATDSSNGAGNLIIGYDEARVDGTASCSFGIFATQPSCESNGGTWGVSHKSGSHYLVVGSQNNYSVFGGIVAGRRNTSSAAFASVSGGEGNTAKDLSASVSGGLNNTASGSHASVSGGNGNTASGVAASVAGGGNGDANGGNTAVHHFSAILGGTGKATTAHSQSLP